jgi:hypothetical protein
MFCAGHGSWDKDMQQGFCLPSKASVNDDSEWLANSTIRNYVKAIKSRHTLLISDAYFSGGLFKTRAITVNKPVTNENGI